MGEFITSTDKIDKVLELLFQRCDDAIYGDICRILDGVYLDAEGKPVEDFRNQYSAVSGKLNELRDNKEKFVRMYGLDMVSSNMEGLYVFAREHQKPYLKNLFKLKDHVGLELGRIAYTDEIRDKILDNNEYNKKLEEQYNMGLKKQSELYAQVENQAQEITKKVEEAKKELEESKKQREEVDALAQSEKEKIENTQKDYIAILGILAAVLVTFTSGSIFSSSVLANIHKSSIYRLSFICVLLGFILVNLVVLLMQFVKWIVQVEKTGFEVPKILKMIDIVLVCLAIIIIAAWFFDIKQASEVARRWLYK